MPKEKFYQQLAKNLLKSELARRNVSYEQLVEQLNHLGIEISYKTLVNRINRGTFSSAFFLACLQAIGCNRLVLEDLFN